MSTGRKHKDYLYRAYLMGGSTTVPADHAREVIIELSQRMSYTAIGKALNTSHNYGTRIARGHIKRISPEREKAILALQNYQPTDTSHVKALGSVRRVRALHALGYSWARLEREIGTYSLGEIKNLAYGRKTVVEAHHAVSIARTYDRLCMSLPATSNKHELSGITRARNTSRAQGWLPPLAWDDIDNLAEKPNLGRERTNYRTADLIAEWEHLRRAGVSDHRAAQQLGVTPAAIEKAYERLRKVSAA